MDQPTGEAMLRALDRFVGEWTMTAGPPDGPPWPGAARVRFEWIEGGAFLAERWRLDAAGLPEGTPTSGTSMYGCDAAHGTYVQFYADDRGVCRVYAMSLHDGEWKLWREGPPFAQRFTGTFSADGRTITGRWEIAEDGEDWRTDFDSTYTKVTWAPPTDTGRRGEHVRVHPAARRSDLRSPTGPRCASLSGLTIALMLVI